MSKPTLNNLVTKLHDNLLPTVSKTKYNNAWQKFQEWMKDNDESVVDEKVLLAYVMAMHDSGYAPTTLLSIVSMLKKKAVSLNHIIPSHVWQKFKSFVDQKSKNYKPTQSESFSGNEIDCFIPSPNNTAELNL